MEIIYVITRSNWGGAQAHVYDLISHRIKKGDRITLIVGERGSLTERLQKLNCEIIVLKTLVRNISPIKDFRSIKDIRKIIKKRNPDIVHLHSSKAGTLGRLAAIGIKCKVIFTAHGWAFTDGVGKLRQFIFSKIEKLLAGLADTIICVSKYDYDLAQRKHVLWKGNGMIIKNGIKKPEEFDKNYNSIPYITMVARFDNPKMQMMLIDALNSIASSLNYECHFIGDGALKSDCEKRVQTLGLSKKIFFEGFKTNVDDYLKKSHINILISNYEGLPLSIIEAMSYSNAIMASEVGGIPELINENSNGFLVKNNIESISEKLDVLLKNMKKIKSFGEHSKSIYEEKFTLEMELSELDKVYETYN